MQEVPLVLCGKSMNYNLIITNRAEELIDERLNYLIYRLKNNQAAKHLLDEIEKLYDRLEDNPFQFTDCRDPFLKNKGYKEALMADSNYNVRVPSRYLPSFPNSAKIVQICMKST